MSISDPKPSLFARGILDVDTYVRAHKVDGGSRAVIWRLVRGAFGVVCIPLGILALQQERPGTAIALVLIGIYNITITALQGFRVQNSIAKQLKQADSERFEVSYEFSDTELHHQTKEGTATLLWSKFRKWKEGQGLILLYRHDRFYIIVPVEQFDSSIQSQVRALVSAHVPRA